MYSRSLLVVDGRASLNLICSAAMLGVVRVRVGSLILLFSKSIGWRLLALTMFNMDDARYQFNCMFFLRLFELRRELSWMAVS